MLHLLQLAFPYFLIYAIKVYTWHIKITRTIYNGNGSSGSVVIVMILVALMVVGSNSNSHSSSTSSSSGSDNNIIVIIIYPITMSWYRLFIRDFSPFFFLCFFLSLCF